MKCRLCDRPTAAGTGKLCADCAKALRRAQGASASLRKLPLSQPNAADETAATDVALTVAPPKVVAPRSKRRATWAAIGLLAITIVYVGERELAGVYSADATSINRSLPAAPERAAVDTAPVPRVEEPSWTALGNAAESAGGSTAQTMAEVNPGKASAAPAGAKTGAKAGSTSKNVNQDSKSTPPPIPAGHDATATNLPEPEPAQQVARASVSSSVQPTDGTQVLASAMQKCGKENLLTKFICEQKTYMEYCEDKWEKDPRCMRKTAER